MAVNNLSPYQLAIQNVAGRGRGATVDAAHLGQIADSIFGPAPVTPGSQITYQDATQVHWIDPEGYQHIAQRDLNGQNPAAGQWQHQTNRPNVLPNVQQQNVAQGLGQQVQQNLTTPLRFAQIDPDTMARLQAISAAEQARNQQQFQQEGGDLQAGLYGRNVQQSSIANEGVARLAQLHGLITQQQQADAAQRELQLRQYLTGIGQQQNQTLAGLYSNLSGQGTQAAISNAGLNYDQQQLAEQERQANQNFQLNQQQLNMQLAQQRSTYGKILAGVNAAAQLAGAVGGGISAYGALTKLGTSGASANEANLRPNYFPSSTYPSNPANYPWP